MRISITSPIFASVVAMPVVCTLTPPSLISTISSSPRSTSFGLRILFWRMGAPAFILFLASLPVGISLSMIWS